MDNTFKIYKITNTTNSKCYIGQTIGRIEWRWSKHKRDAFKGSDFYFHRAIRKYGEKTFRVEVIAYALSKNLLNNLEVELITQYNSFGKGGYNLTTGGRANTKVSAETREKISKLHKGNTYWLGKKHTEEAKQKMSSASKGNTNMLGKKHSEETKREMRESRKNPSVETRKKLSRAAKGNARALGYKHTEATKMKLSLINKGKKLSEEHKERLRESNMGNTYGRGNKGKKLSEESKRKMSIVHKGKRLTEEHKRKIGDSSRGLLNPNSRGLVHTPNGTFNSTAEAEKFCKCHAVTVGYRCNNPRPQWSKWYYEKPKSTESQQDPIQSQHNKCDSPKQNVSP